MDSDGNVSYVRRDGAAPSWGSHALCSVRGSSVYVGFMWRDDERLAGGQEVKEALWPEVGENVAESVRLGVPSIRRLLRFSLVFWFLRSDPTNKNRSSKKKNTLTLQNKSVFTRFSATFRQFHAPVPLPQCVLPTVLWFYADDRLVVSEFIRNVRQEYYFCCFKSFICYRSARVKKKSKQPVSA